MPELPEVETVVRGLREPLIGKTIVGVRNSWPRHIVLPDLPEMAARIHGRTVTAIGRRAKYLVFDLDSEETLVVHLKMTGHLSVVPAGMPADRYAHTVFSLAGGDELRFRDPRKFGRVYLVRDPGPLFARLGPEPLDEAFTAEALAGRLHKRKRVIKPLLLDQAFIAGVGNIYADEALHEAGLHPQRSSHSLKPAEVERLHQAVRQVLREGIEREGASVDRFRQPNGEMGRMQEVLRVYGRKGEPCPRCGAPIERIVLGGRSTHYCPQCQL
jgi:formamidopyrimidine-DNA glycosylase